MFQPSGLPSGPPMCIGCGCRPTYNGRSNEYCTKTCRSACQGSNGQLSGMPMFPPMLPPSGTPMFPPSGPPMCIGCGRRPTYNGLPGGDRVHISTFAACMAFRLGIHLSTRIALCMTPR
eukprot:3471237-Amphidinium_carterae.1